MSDDHDMRQEIVTKAASALHEHFDTVLVLAFRSNPETGEEFFHKAWKGSHTISLALAQDHLNTNLAQHVAHKIRSGDA